MKRALCCLLAAAFSYGTASAQTKSPLRSEVIQRPDIADMGPALPTQSVRLRFVLSFQHEAELRQLVLNQASRSSPLYGKFLTRAQFNNYYAPSPAQYAALGSRLRAAGFTVTGGTSGRSLLEVTGPVAVVDRFLSTGLRRVSHRGRIAFANSLAPQVPSDIAPSVTAVLGLNNLSLVTTNVSVV